MKFLVVLCILGLSQAATVVDPSTCTVFPCLIFDDEFDFLDHDVWEHEITMSGGGNWEFQAYVNNRSISYTRDSVLYIKPELTSDWLYEGTVDTVTMNLWGMNGRGDVCTGNSYYGCERVGNAVNIVNPVMSARLRSSVGFSFKYGRMEMRAQLPRGNWLWPAAWLLQKNWPYGPWPASSEIDMFESRGNDDYGTLGNAYAGSTLHWGPYYPYNRYDLTTSQYQTDDLESFADDFHIWRMDWNDAGMQFYLDGVLTLSVDPVTNFWDYGQFTTDIGDIDNPWEGQGKMAPFDQKFYILLNLAVGGTNGFFPDGVDPAKPWLNTSPQAFLDFWNGKDTWLPTWTQGESSISEGAALKVDYVKVYKQVSTEM